MHSLRPLVKQGPLLSSLPVPAARARPYIRAESMSAVTNNRVKPGDVYLHVDAKFDRRVSEKVDAGTSLTSYMTLPPEQYVCLSLPMGAQLERVGNNRFSLKVPPMKFFSIEVFPFAYATVWQNDTMVV